MANHIDYLKEEGMFDTMSEDNIYAFIEEGYQGTCDGMSEDDWDWLDEHGRFMQLDNAIFHCTCGWWCDISESNDLDGENVCNDCFDE